MAYPLLPGKNFPIADGCQMTKPGRFVGAAQVGPLAAVKSPKQTIAILLFVTDRVAWLVALGL